MGKKWEAMEALFKPRTVAVIGASDNPKKLGSHVMRSLTPGGYRSRIYPELYENTSFHKTAQWVGKFYHYHDIVLFIFLFLFAISFVISLGVDWWSEMPFGRTAQDFWNSLTPVP